jgi:hypothetical protein
MINLARIFLLKKIIEFLSGKKSNENKIKVFRIVLKTKKLAFYITKRFVLSHLAVNPMNLYKIRVSVGIFSYV